MMPGIKDKLLKNDSDKEVTLDEFEFSYVRDLNTALQFNVFRQKLVSGFLTYLAKTRFGYKDGVKAGYILQFEIDLKADDRKLVIHEVPDKD